MRGDRRRAAALTGAAARLAITVVLLAAGFTAIGVVVAGGLGAAVAVVLAAALVTAVYVYGDRMALSAMAAQPVSEVAHPDLYRLVRELSKVGRLPVPPRWHVPGP